MALSGTIAEAFIKIALSGVNTINTQINSLQAQVKTFGDGFKKMGEGISNIAIKSTIAFTTLAGGLLKATSAADPVRFSMFKAQMDLIGVNLGSIFLPTLDKVIVALNRFQNWIWNLSDAQKRAIRENVEFALKVLAVVSAVGLATAAFGTIIKIIGSAISIFQGAVAAVEGLSVLWGALGAIAGAATLPVWAFIAAIVAVVAAISFYISAIYSALEESKTLTSLIKSVGLAFTVAKELIFAALSPLIAFFTAFWNVIETTWTGILSIIKPIWDKVNEIVEKAIEKWQAIYAKGQKYLDIFREVLIQAWEKIKSAIAPFIDALVVALDKLWDAFSNLIDSIGDGGVFDVLVGTFIELAKWAAEIAGWLAKAFGSTIVNMITNVISVVSSLINTISTMFDALRNQWNQMITYMTKYDPTSKFAKMPFWMRNINDTEKSAKDRKGSDRTANKATQMSYGVRPQVATYAIEDAFKKAQQGAFQDPNLLVLKRQLEIQQQTYEATKQTAENTKPQIRAEQIG